MQEATSQLGDEGKLYRTLEVSCCSCQSVRGYTSAATWTPTACLNASRRTTPAQPRTCTPHCHYPVLRCKERVPASFQERSVHALLLVQARDGTTGDILDAAIALYPFQLAVPPQLTRPVSSIDGKIVLTMGVPDEKGPSLLVLNANGAVHQVGTQHPDWLCLELTLETTTCPVWP